MAANESNKKNPSLSRCVRAYPPPKYHSLVVGMSKCNDISKSEITSIALKEYFDRMPESEKMRFIASSKNTY